MKLTDAWKMTGFALLVALQNGQAERWAFTMPQTSTSSPVRLADLPVLSGPGLPILQGP